MSWPALFANPRDPVAGFVAFRGTSVSIGAEFGGGLVANNKQINETPARQNLLDDVRRHTGKQEEYRGHAGQTYGVLGA
jgi:hypothetical protein